MKPYFSHDEGARNDPKLIEVLMTLGHEGKSVYWDLVEMLYEQGGYLMLSQCKGYAFALRTDCDLILRLVSDFELFATDGEKFWSETALRRLTLRNAKSEKAKESAAKRWGNSERNANALPTQSEGNAIKGKEIKLKTTSVVGGGGPTAAALALKAEILKREQSVAAHTDPDALQTVAESPLSKPDKFAVIVRSLGYENVDVERYRLQIIAKSEGVTRTASQWRNRVIEFLNNDHAAGKLLVYAVQTPNEIPSNWNPATQGPYVAPRGMGIPPASAIYKPEYLPS